MKDELKEISAFFQEIRNRFFLIFFFLITIGILFGIGLEIYFRLKSDLFILYLVVLIVAIAYASFRIVGKWLFLTKKIEELTGQTKEG